jgi:hypothetical protein
MDQKRQNTGQQSETERNRQQPEPQKLSENPNPRANENIQPSSIEKEPDKNSTQTGSEITDGEDA